MAVNKVNWRDQLVVMMKHNSFKTHDGASEESYGIPRWCKVAEEGPAGYHFDTDDYI